jgi:hypothetical protein
VHLYDEPTAVQCPECSRWWKPGNEACERIHLGKGCCHYGDKEVAPPDGTAPVCRRAAGLTGAMTPAPVSFADFEKAWDKACAGAWDDGLHSPAVLLPDFMWPGVAYMVNPVTGVWADVHRVSTFPVQNDMSDDGAEM